MTWPDGYGRAIHDRLDGTNAEGSRRAAAGDGGPAWILAHAQTAARGRRGRSWAMPEGNFAASLLMLPGGSLAEMALRSFVAALALHDAFTAATGRAERFALKWPNDVLLDGKKVAGILLETGGAPPGPLALVIGFGVNLVAAPDPGELEPGALAPSTLAAAGPAPDPVGFLDLLAPAFAAWETRFRAEGFAPVRAAWLSRAARLGETVTARLPDRAVVGRFESVDERGAIVLATATGREILPAADVFFPGEPVHAARD